MLLKTLPHISQMNKSVPPSTVGSPGIGTFGGGLSGCGGSFPPGIGGGGVCAFLILSSMLYLVPALNVLLGSLKDLLASGSDLLIIIH